MYRLDGNNAKNHTEYQHDKADNVVRRNAEFHMIFQLCSCQTDREVSCRY